MRKYITGITGGNMASEILTHKETLKMLQELRPIDDMLFGVLATDKPFCQEMLRVILEDNRLVVKEARIQAEERNLIGRSVRLDALCELGDGTVCNIEVQNRNDDDNFRRIRYNESCITASETEPGTRFENVPNVIVIYISKFDILKKNKTTYHIDRVVRETGDIIDDGSKVICVNTKVNDGSLTAELMQLFKQSEVNNPKFPAFTKRMNYIKHTEGGRQEMCEVAERIRIAGREEGRVEGRVEGREEAKDEMIREMLLDSEPVDKIVRYAHTDEVRVMAVCQKMIDDGELAEEKIICTRHRR